MSSEPDRCTAITRKGTPCKAWAVRGSDPPLCAPHAGLTGGTLGNQNAVIHGYYRQRLEPDEIESLRDQAGDVNLDQAAVLLQVSINRLSKAIHDPGTKLEDLKTIIPLIVSTSRALAYVNKQRPHPHALDIDAALDELGQAWGWDL